ncbi:MAG: D-aminoacylase [Planctomycetaceae bacterium]|nr:D-aminoacylase [Planctomycetaceae bacterium]
MLIRILLVASVSLLSLWPVANLPGQVLIRNAQVVDGSGEAPRQVDVLVTGTRITTIGKNLSVSDQTRVIDAKGLVLAPGFIDLHSHSDRTIIKDSGRQNLNYLTQGVTSVLTGNCASGPVDVGAYYQKIDKDSAGTNVMHLVPQGSVRRQVTGNENRAASPREIKQMADLVEKGMRDGAWGMSTGLIYLPSSYASKDELVQLARRVAMHGGIYASHIRNENTRLLEAVEEALTIGREAGLPVHISHFKASGLKAWGLASEAVALLVKAREGGQRVTADQYPYTASSTSLGTMVVPAKYRNREALVKALGDEKQARQVKEAIRKGIQVRGEGKRLYVAGYRKNREWQGKNLDELARQEKTTPLEIVLEIQQNGGASMVNFGMDEAEVRYIMKQTFVATASDGSARSLNDETQPHPRNFGCFPRKIGHYCLRGNVLPLSQAIRSATGLPADILHLPERGYVRQGYWADLVLFDPKNFIDTATFAQPKQLSTGVRFLWVNGELAIENGKPTGKLAGRALRHSMKSKSKP